MKKEVKGIDEIIEMWVLLTQAGEATCKARQQELNQYGISSIQANLLHTIKYLGEEATPVNLSKKLIREHNSITTILQRMEAKGLIKRKKNKKTEGRSRIKIVLTEKGEKITEMSTKRESIYDIFSCISEEERPKLMAYLRTIRSHALNVARMTDDLLFPP
jgi:DNA-binding MarR family transcriptional regulator